MQSVHQSIRQPEGLQEILGASEHVVEGGLSPVGGAVGEEFDLVELVHAQDTARVLPRRAGLAAKARREGAEAHRQLVLVEELPASQ